MDADTRENLIDLFTPGQGVSPPYLAGRERELRQLDVLLHPLRRAIRDRNASNKAPPRDAILVGPRGNGKTVLLAAFVARCRAAGTDVVEATPVRIKSNGALARWLLNGNSPLPAQKTGKDEKVLERLAGFFGTLLKKCRAWFPDKSVLGIPGVLSGQWEKLSEEDELQTLENLDSLLQVACWSTPRVAIVDEAHTLDREVGRLLLHTSQQARVKNAPFLLVLAGTPNLLGHLNTMDSTFWSRSQQIGVGRLSDAATRAALMEPLARYGVSFTEKALNQVVTESQCYPYFIQCWGAALCQNLVQREQDEDHEIEVGIVAAARPEFETARTGYYENRCREFEERGLLAMATEVTRVFGDAERMDRNLLIEGVARITGASEETVRPLVESLADLGYLWQPPGQTVVEPGIPSLMNHVVLKKQAIPGKPGKMAVSSA